MGSPPYIPPARALPHSQLSGLLRVGDVRRRRRLRVRRHVIVKRPVEIAVGLRSARGGRELRAVEGVGIVWLAEATAYEVAAKRQAENAAAGAVDREVHAGNGAIDRDAVGKPQHLLAPRRVRIGWDI